MSVLTSVEKVVSAHTPDEWALVQMTLGGGVLEYHRILAGWLNTDGTLRDAKLSSPVMDVTPFDDCYSITTYGGSKYFCEAHRYSATLRSASCFQLYAATMSDEMKLELLADLPAKQILDEVCDVNNMRIRCTHLRAR